MRPSLLEILFPDRIARMEFLFRNFILNLLLLPCVALLNTDEVTGILILIAFCFGATAFFVWYSVIPRLRDLGWSPKLAWFACVPGLNALLSILLVLTPGKPQRP